MINRTFVVFLVSLLFILVSCKPDGKSNQEAGAGSVSSVSETKANNKILNVAGAEDVSETFVLDQKQIVQDGNVGFNFKSANAMRIYLEMPGDQNIDFENDEVFAIFSEKTVKKTSFKVEKIDLDAERPTIYVVSNISTETVVDYRPSFVVSVPKEKIKGYPLIKLDGIEIPVTTMQ